MRIAVCIQNKDTCELLTQLFRLYQEENNCSLFSHFYKNDTELVCDLTGGEYDMILFSNPSGGRLAEEIREKDRRVRLVRIAALDSVTQSGGDIWYCLPEPPGHAFLFPILDRLRLDSQQSEEAGILVKSRGAVATLAFSRIEYVEVMGRTVFFHLTNGETEEVFGTFSTFEAKLLHWPDFIKVHRAYIVNLRHIQKLESGGILTTGGHSVPVSRHLYPQLKRDYLCLFMDPETKQELPADASIPIEASASGKFSILLVDDEEEQRLHWSAVLKEHGCTVQTAETSERALQFAGQGQFDCIVLDVRLGTQSGFDLCSRLIAQSGAPVVFLSSLDDGESQAQGFLSGGIDYITKNASDTLFWLKIEARIKMAQAGRAELCDGSLRLDLKSRKAYLLKQEVALTAVEFDLLFFLVQNAGVVFTPARIYEVIWGTRQWDGGQGVQMHLSMLGRKLTSIYPGHNFIETVWGEGYHYVPMSSY